MYKKSLKILMFACIVVPIAIFIVQVDFAIVLAELRKIGSGFFVILLITLIAYMLGTIGWWICLGSERTRISLGQLFGIRQIGETVGLYNPSSVVGGDMLKNELLKSYSISHSNASTSVVVSRVTAILSQLLLFILSLCWLVVIMDNSRQAFWLYGLCILIALLLSLKILFFYLLHQKRSTVETQEVGSFNLWQRLCRVIRRIAVQTRCFFQHHTKLFWWSYFFFFLHWLIGGLEFYFILCFLNYDVPLMHSVWMDMGVMIFKSVGAFIPGQLGIEELGNKILLASISIQGATVWITVSILRRARQICWILVGVICYVFVRKTDTLNIFKHGNTVR